MNHKAKSHLIASPNSRALNAWAVLASWLHRTEVKWHFFGAAVITVIVTRNMNPAEYKRARSPKTDKARIEILALGLKTFAQKWEISVYCIVY